ncbi:MAG: riboflavin synthase [Parcubacteria group bacterium]|nr:riboflavin synthase [Parcubacteria group bacterium]
MFSGIISATAKVRRMQKDRQGLRLAMTKPKSWRVKIGESIAVNGVCSTVTRVRPDLQFQYMPETLKRTNLSTLITGSTVNLEQPLALGDRISGSVVHGLVDTVGTIAAVKRAGNSHIVRITVEARKFLKLVAVKAPVTVEGISLTVVDVGKNFFTTHVIPYTWQHTNLKEKRIGDGVNLEFDLVAKYLQRYFQHRSS